jgi:glucokinase
VAEGCVIGVDLGGTKLLAGAVDADLTVHHRTNRPALGLDQMELVEMIAHAVEAGAAAGCSEVALLTIGTGIGGGLVLGGEVYRGFIGGGAEMGHMVVDMDGRPCQGNCPNWGCLESVASGSALVREASLAVARMPDTALGRALEEGRELTGPMITRLAREGDPVARGAIEVVGRALGVGVANLVNIFNPQVVVIGGGVSEAGDLLLDPAREVMKRRALRPGRDEVRVEAAAFGAEAGMIGAALLARERPAGFPLAATPGTVEPAA